MITKITGEQPFQVLTNNFSISPSNEGYTLQISADGKQYSNLFTVGAGVTRLVTGVAANSYYRLSGNQSQVSVNWMKTCVTEGGSGGAGNELTPVADFPQGAEAGTVVAYNGTASASGVYQYTGEEWVPVGVDDLSAYWTSAQTQSAITAVEDHLYDVEQITASALTELHEGLLEVSGRSVDLSPFWTSAQTQSAITAALADLDLSNYATSGDMQSAFTLIQETQQVAAAGLNQLEGRIDELSGNTPDMSAFWTSAETEEAIVNKNYVTSAQVETQIDTKAAAYTPTSGFSTINGSAITNGGNIVIEGGSADMSEYWTSAETKAQIDELADELSEAELVTSTSINDIKDNMVSSDSINTIWRGTQAEYDTLALNNQIDNNTLYVIL